MTNFNLKLLITHAISLLCVKDKKMYKTILSIFLSFLCLQSYAQEQLPSAADYKQFYNTKTLVVIEGSPLSGYNFKIKELIKQNWHSTEYAFISYDEFKKKKSDPKYSFLITSTVTFNKDKTNAKYHFLSLLLGGPAQDLASMTDLCSIPLSYLYVDEDRYLYKMGSLIHFVQNHVDLVMQHPEIISKNVLKYYNKNSVKIKGKTLYLLQEELQKDANSISKIRKVYPGKVKFVNEEEIEAAIASKNEEVVFLHKVGPEHTKHKARCFKVLIGAGDGKFYYFDYHMVKKKQTDHFLLSDFRRIAN